MGIGRASGDGRAEEAAKQAIQSPLLETSIEGARGVLLNITGGADLGLFEVNMAAELVQKSADPDANIIVGAVIDENLKDEILITVIATGFEKGTVLRKIEKVVERPAAAKPEQAPAVKLHSSGEVSDDELEIPTFLRKNRFK
jgi:cell division protein FtsZ